MTGRTGPSKPLLFSLSDECERPRLGHSLGDAALEALTGAMVMRGPRTDRNASAASVVSHSIRACADSGGRIDRGDSYRDRAATAQLCRRDLSHHHWLARPLPRAGRLSRQVAATPLSRCVTGRCSSRRAPAACWDATRLVGSLLGAPTGAARE